MPAETHSTHEGIDARDVMDLMDALVGADDVILGADTSLADVGLDDELGVFDVCRAVADEFAERSVADLDVEELMLARTVGELAEAIMRALPAAERADFPTRR